MLLGKFKTLIVHGRFCCDSVPNRSMSSIPKWHCQHIFQTDYFVDEKLILTPCPLFETSLNDFLKSIHSLICIYRAE